MAEKFDASHSKVTQRTIHTTFFVWDGDTLLQEIEHNKDQSKTTTYLYEPDSFVPAAQIISQDEEEIYALGTVYLPHIADWDTPTIKNSANAHVNAWLDWQGEHKHSIVRAQREQEAERKAQNDQRYFYQCDHLGTPLELLDVDGNTVWAAKYKAWGGVFQFDVAKANQALRFQGQYFDAETGLHYNRHRYYDPETARFVTQDPIGLDGGVNVYSYALNPLAWVDPLGLAKNGQLGKYNDLAKGKPNTGDQLEAHELIRNEALEQMGCGAKTKKAALKPTNFLPGVITY